MVPTDAKATTVGALVRNMTKLQNAGDLYEQGSPQQYTSSPRKSPSLSDFSTHSPAEKIAVRYTHQRYDEQSEGEEIAPRDYGIMMHRVMENVATREDIERNISLCLLDGVLTEQEAEELRQYIANALSNEVVAEWFDGSWESLRSERDIIFNGRSWRPDRVIIRGDRAVVVDYKFGSIAQESHRRQIIRYAELLQQMGYKSVSGYLWYVVRQEVEKIV